jgi:hypothetical protein
MSMAKKRKARIGRPPLPKGTARRATICIRLTAIELRALKAEAKRRGISCADLLLEPWRKRK